MKYINIQGKSIEVARVTKIKEDKVKIIDRIDDILDKSDIEYNEIMSYINKLFLIDKDKAELDKKRAHIDKKRVPLDKSRARLDKEIADLDEKRIELEKYRAKLDKWGISLDEKRVNLDKKRVPLDKSKAGLDKEIAESDEKRIALDKGRANLDKLEEALIDKSKSFINKTNRILGALEIYELTNRSVEDLKIEADKLKMMDKVKADNINIKTSNLNIKHDLSADILNIECTELLSFNSPLSINKATLKAKDITIHETLKINNLSIDCDNIEVMNLVESKAIRINAKQVLFKNNNQNLDVANKLTLTEELDISIKDRAVVDKGAYIVSKDRMCLSSIGNEAKYEVSGHLIARSIMKLNDITLELNRGGRIISNKIEDNLKENSVLSEPLKESFDLVDRDFRI